MSCFFFISSHAQIQFWNDNFEGAPSSGVRTPEENGGTVASYFRLTDGSTASQVVTFTGKEGTNYWAGEDHNGPGTGFTTSGAQNAAPANNPLNELHIVWSSINISGKSTLSFKGLFAANSTSQPWDNEISCGSGSGTTNTDYIIVEYSIDGGAWQSLIRFYNKGGATNTIDKYLYEETTGDNCGDGTKLTDAFGEFSKNIPGTGATLSIRIRVFSEGANEEWGIDNFRLFEVPACVPPVFTGNPPNRTICAGNNTTFPSTATGATGYQWQENSGSGFTNLANGGVYSGVTTNTLTITGATAGMSGNLYRCIAYNPTIACFTNSNQATLTISSINTGTGSQTNVSCNGGNNGSASITPSGGISPYTYSWSPSGGTAATASSLTAGSYTVTVTDNIGCTATRNYTITQPPVLNGSTVVTNVACNGGNTGAINLTPSGGSPGYTFNWGGGITTEDRTGLTAGTYSVTITDANGCTRTVSGITVTQPTVLSGTTVVTNVACNGNTTGAINLTPTGGTGPYTFNWGGGITSEDRTGLAAGTYSVTITDANGCTGTVSPIVVTQPTVLSGTTVVTNVACNGNTTGAINLTPTGGTGPYTFNWGGGITTEDRTGLAAGTYSVTITDANGCTGTVSPTVTQPAAAVSGTTVITNVACFGGNNGAINLTPTGGVGPYTFNWGGGITTEDRTALTAGTYSVTITDANGCTGTISPIVVTQPTAAVTGTTIVTNIACFGGTTGSINLTPTGGTGPYTFNWGGGITTEDRTGLTAGTYSVTITDANGCTGTVSPTVTQPASVLGGTTVVTNVACFSGTTGAINLTPTGGTGPYTFNWGGGITTEDRTGLAAGTYSVTITDNNGCTATVNGITVTQPAAAVSGTTVVTNISCNGGTNGAINLTPTGGSGPYTFNWGGGITTEDRTGLAAGTYSVTITDANGCAGTVSGITITEPANALLALPVSQTNVACNGSATGSATVSASDGTPGYTYSWTPSGGTAATASGLTAGTYTVTVTDANGCQATQSFTITEPANALLALPVSQTNVACNGAATGAATVSASDGTPGYTYSWAPSGGTAATASGLTAGTYTVTVTDANGCQATQSFTITEPTAISTATGTQTNVSCNGGTNGTASVTPSGGAPGYTYSWSPSGGTNAIATGLAAGTYTVTVTDANGCTATRDYTLTEPTAISTATGSQTNASCNGETNGSASVTPSGGTPGYTYSWSPSGGTAATATGLAAGTYTVTVTDANGCTATRNYTLTEPAAIDATITLTGEVLTANQAGATYQWFECPNTLLSGETNQSFSPTASGDYKVTITLDGCSVDSNCQTTVLGMDDFNAKRKFVMYPNPNKGILNIESSFDGDLQIVNQLGQIVRAFKVNMNNTNTINLENLTDGIYFVNGANQTKITTQKLIIKK